MAEAPIAYTLMRIANMLEEILRRLPPPKEGPLQIEVECAHCGNFFKAGAGTGRRIDASFCCDEHRVRYHSLKRSEAGRPREI